MNIGAKLNRIDYLQVGLTSQNTLKALSPGSSDNHLTVIAVIGDHSGSIHCFSLRPEPSTLVNTIFRTLPNPNGKVNCLQVARDVIGSPKILIAFGSSMIRGYTGKGKQFFGLQLNNLTEPIKHFQIIWPVDVYICGYYIYNHYVLTPDTWTDGKNSNSSIQSKHFYISPSKITGFIVTFNSVSKRPVPIISCEDRLIRILKNSTCQYEIETCGIPCVLFSLERSSKSSKVNLLYGTIEGKVALISLDFGFNEVNAEHKWQIPDKGYRSQVNCITMMESTGELYIGRSDGLIEVWVFMETLESNGSLLINVDQSPTLLTDYNCGESLTSICICREGTLILCCTFTGLIFGLNRDQMNSSNYEQPQIVSNRDMEHKINSLKTEIDQLEKKLNRKREFYQNLTSGLILNKKQKNSPSYSTLPYFTINDSLILHDDASYILALESEVAIDSVIVQSDIPIELIDSERNSAVYSLNEQESPQVLATFRCQANTTRFEIKMQFVEGQAGTLRLYILTRMNPKSCQVKIYYIKALSLHKRNYHQIDQESLHFVNKLHIYGSFGLIDCLNWLQLCLPEVPERIDLINSTSIEYHYLSTLMGTFLEINFYKGSLIFQSNNLSTIAILKDAITREATKKSISIEVNLHINENSLGHTIRKLYPKLKQLLSEKRIDLIKEAVKDLHVVEPEIAESLSQELESNSNPILIHFNLERLYGLITDLFLDYFKLEGLTSRLTVSNVRGKLDELIKLIESNVNNEDNQVDILVEKLNEFWGIKTMS
ncbi:Bardet-Biedl syndrome 7 protein-like [Tetranychus urticae]|uniref:Bardet-Biedl syndrome 7 protein homolog n=1 Tax=Tetranychus urticae TaxID=32264 RepID=T1KWA3_TETUR|nr:Bardet-Biedl syndrome 7 protein-like [Tetranychus urticae]